VLHADFVGPNRQVSGWFAHPVEGQQMGGRLGQRNREGVHS